MMTKRFEVGRVFPDIALPDQSGDVVSISGLMAPGLQDEMMGFVQGYPLVLIFYRGFFCPRDQVQMRQLVEFQDELAVNYARCAAVSVDPPMVQAAFRAGLGARWPFLCDEDRAVVRRLGILDETEGEYAYPSRPFTFLLRPDLTLHKVYDGWFFVGRPTLGELRQDLRAIMETLANYRYEAYDTPEARRIRIPQQEWTGDPPRLGASGLPVVSGVVRWFDRRTGSGMIDWGLNGSRDVFFNFTAIPGEGYRTIDPGTAVRFELVEGPTGLSARNIQRGNDVG